MCKKAIFLSNPDDIAYFDGRFLVTEEEFLQYESNKACMKRRKQLIKKLRNYWRKRR